MNLERALEAIEEVFDKNGYIFLPFFSKEDLEKRIRNKEIKQFPLFQKFIPQHSRGLRLFR